MTEASERPPYAWILFDLDGTLFDYEHAELVALDETFRSLGLEPSDELVERYRRINGSLWRDYEQRAVSQAELRVERFLRFLLETSVPASAHKVAELYQDRLGRQTRFLPGAEQLLDELDGSHRLALITNGIASVQRPRLALSGLDRRFEVVVISEEVGAAKPAPEIFDAAFAAMEQPAKDDVLMVGDSLSSDIDGAAAYGLDTCWFNPAGRPAATENATAITYTIDSLDQLAPIAGTRACAEPIDPGAR